MIQIIIGLFFGIMLLIFVIEVPTYLKTIGLNLLRIANALEAQNRCSGVYDGEENIDPVQGVVKDMAHMQPGETWQQFKERTGR